MLLSQNTFRANFHLYINFSTKFNDSSSVSSMKFPKPKYRSNGQNGTILPLSDYHFVLNQSKKEKQKNTHKTSTNHDNNLIKDKKKCFTWSCEKLTIPICLFFTICTRRSWYSKLYLFIRLFNELQSLKLQTSEWSSCEN